MSAGVPAGTLYVEVVAEMMKLQADMEKVKKVVGDMSSDVGRKTKAVNDNFESLGKGSRLAGHHVQNLAFQFNDLAVQIASGSNPMIAFVQQGSQISGIMAQAGIGIGGLVKEIGLMITGFLAANPLLLAATAAAGLVAAGLALVTDEINKNSSVTVTWQDVLLGAFDVVKEAISSRVTAAFEAMGLDIGEVWESVKKFTKAAINFIIGANMAVPKLILATYDKIPAAFGDAFYSAANLAIRALNELARMSAAPLNLIIAGFNEAFGTDIPKIVIGGISEIANPYAGAMSALGSAAAKSLIGSFTTDYIGNAASALSEASQRRARIREAAEKAGESAGSAGGKAAGAAMAKAAAETFGKNLLTDIARNNAKLGEALEKALGADLAQQAQAEWDKFTDKLNRAGEELPDAFEEALRASGAWNEELRRTVDLLDQIGGAGEGLGDLAAALVGLTSGDWSGTRGPLGHLMQTIGGITWRDAPDANGPGQIRILRDEIVKGLDHVFGGSGSFAKTMSSVLQGAGTGAAIGQIMGGSQASQFGAIAGGALGQVAGQEIGKAIGGTLGKFAGPVGSILGSVAGSLLGGIFKESKSKANVITNGDLTGTFGHTGGDYTRGADALSKAVLDNLERLADALGATATGAYQVSIGMRDGNYVYNPTGSGTKASMGAINVGKDADAAVRGAIQDAISDGVFEGLSAGVERLLKGEGDLDTQLQKALSFQGVFDELERMKDPQGFELKGLGKEFDRLREVFAEAGASTEEYAQLEELYQLKRKEILESGLADAGSAAEIESQRRQMEIQLMELTGDKAGALAAARAMELEQIDPTLRALASEIYARQDALEIRRLEIELMRAQGNEAGAVAAQRELELAALAPLQAALTQQIWAAQDAAAANAALADAQQQAANAAAAAASRMASLQERLLRAQGDEAGLLAFQRAQELGAALSDAEKAMLQQIYAAEDAARVAAEAAARNEEQRRQEAEAARAADELARQRSALELELLRAQGKEEEAMRREREAQLAAMDASLRGLQQQVWAEQELAKVREAAAQKVDDARSALTTAWERENRALQDTIDTFGDLRRELVGFRASLFQSAGFEDFAAQQARYSRTLALARTGQEAALRDLPAVAGGLRDALRDRATSRVDYQLELARMARDIDQAIGATDAVVDFNQLQLDALDRSVEGLIDIKDEVVSVREAIAELRAALQEQTNVTKEVGKKQIANSNELNRILNDAADGVQPLTFQTAET